MTKSPVESELDLAVANTLRLLQTHMLHDINAKFSKSLKNHRTIAVGGVTTLSVAGSIASLVSLQSLSWQNIVIGSIILSWLIFGTIILYNKLNKLSTRIEASKRRLHPGEFIYIEGEDEAMEALIATTSRAKKIICSTRFFPCPIAGRHERYAAAIRNRMLGGDGSDPLKIYYRIVAANKPEKLEDVKNYIRQFHGKPFRLYLTHKANSFELVIVDEQETFIHFYGKDSVIGSTLYIPGHEAAARFREVFDRLKDRRFDESVLEINCQYIRETEIEKYIHRAEAFFAMYVPPGHGIEDEIEELLNPAGNTNREQGGARQPAIRPDSKS